MACEGAPRLLESRRAAGWEGGYPTRLLLEAACEGRIRKESFRSSLSARNHLFTIAPLCGIILAIKRIFLGIR